MVGVDEVGRGAWAGPLLVVAARQIDNLPPDLVDSKLMSPRQRVKMLDLLSDCCRFGEGWVEPAEIDSGGLAEALKTGVAQALTNLGAAADEDIVIDGIVNYAPPSYSMVSCVIDADASIPLVSAASVFAKVTRDKFMRSLSADYPEYGFDSHVGYGTKQHREALRADGIIKGIHRVSFKPLQKFELAI